jgi:hypothetical protein
LVAQGAPANAQLAALLARTAGPIISEDMGALVTSGKPVVYYTFQYSSLARSGKWDQSWELTGLREGTFPLVVLESGTREDVDHYRRFTRDFVSSLDRYYALVREMGPYEIYTPAPALQIQAAEFGPIRMVGWTVVPYSRELGGIPVSIVWQADHPMDFSYTAFVHLERGDGSKVAQADSPPHEGAYPTTRWAVGEYVREQYLLRLPGALPPGNYALRVGWYDPSTGDRLTVPGSKDDSVLLQISNLGGQ